MGGGTAVDDAGSGPRGGVPGPECELFDGELTRRENLASKDVIETMK